MAEHPLEPLSADEFRQVTAVLRRDAGVTDAFRFCSVELVEPPKQRVLAWSPGGEFPRKALAVLWDRDSSRTFEAVVDLAADSVASFEHRPDVTPNFTVDEWHDCDHAMRHDQQVIEALAARGITDLDLCLFDVWTYGRALMPPQFADRRLGWVDVWRRGGTKGNPYAHPVAGLKFIVDMNTFEVLQIDDAGQLPDAPVMGEYVPELVPGMKVREDRKPLEITQPEGPGFTVDGLVVRWHEWQMRLGFNFREGPVIYQLSYGGRSVAYRMSFAEMIVPYRDPTPEHYRRTAYDIGEWGLGYMTTSLELGCDCLGEIRYLDAVLPDSQGEPYDITNAICMHEEDSLVLWKHVDADHGAEVRRMRRFVVSVHATVANYEYLVYWRFYEDGNIECEVRATGIMVTTPLPEGQTSSPYGTTVDHGTYAPYHQHFLVARLDLDVDGTDNTALEVDSVVVPTGPDNPYGLALTTKATPIASESESGRDYNWDTQRGWKVVNPGKNNGLGYPVGYKLVPGACFPVMMDPGSPQFQRAPVLGHQLWVTKHHDDERWPAGAYPTQSSRDVGGISDWIADDEPLENTDIVLWYLFGIHHITRPEEWPIMPADAVAFWLKPFGFFDRNPTLDVAPSEAACHVPAEGHHGHEHLGVPGERHQHEHHHHGEHHH
jgi:primary-amine oxidase